MIITLINFISENVNNFKKRNRNKPSYYRLFLLWLTLVILISAIFYSLDKLNLNRLRVVKFERPLVEEKVELPNIVYNKMSYSPEKSELYHEILNKVGQIPKPLSFIDDFDFNL